MNVLAVIPARGGSKGIPRKNMRLMNGKPLIGYAIENALNCKAITHVVVSTDSQEIASYAQDCGASFIMRDAKLAADAVTLDPVIHDATLRMEQSQGLTYDAVVTLQPTSPLLKPETLDEAFDRFFAGDADTVISCVNQPHLSWTKDDKGVIVPAYKERLNRQQLPANYLETGAFLLTMRPFVTPSSRLGNQISVFEVDPRESVDIDSFSDWMLAESLLSAKRIVFRVDGYKERGLGHIYRALTLAYALTGHHITFICNKFHTEGVQKLRSCFMNVVEIESEEDTFRYLASHPTDVVITDILDTHEPFIRELKRLAGRVVSFEDLGSGTVAADAVINALHEPATAPSNFYCGQDYACLRDEFLITQPAAYHKEVKRVFVMFGGADPLNLTARVVNMALQENAEEIRYHFDVVLGPAYQGQFDKELLASHGVAIHRDVARVSYLMKQADLAFTSQGRSVYELCCMHVPAIVIAQNEREQTHTFASMSNGFVNLGLGTCVSDHDIERTFRWIVEAPTIRKQMVELMSSKHLDKGINRVINIILGE